MNSDCVRSLYTAYFNYGRASLFWQQWQKYMPQQKGSLTCWHWVITNESLHKSYQQEKWKLHEKANSLK